MKILWLTENYPPQRGGMAQSCDRIIAGLRSHQVVIEVIHFTNQPGTIARKQQQGGGLVTIPFEESEPHTLNIAWNYLRNSTGYDYVAAFGGHLAMIAGPIFAKWLDTNLITFLRGNDFDTSIFTPRKRDVLMYALEVSTFVFTVTDQKSAKVKKLIPAASIKYVPNGIGIDDWQVSQSEVVFSADWKKTHARNKKVLGIVGQLKPKKGVKFFVEALAKTSLTEELHLLLIGEMEERLVEQLEQSQVSFSHLEFLDRFELIKYYACCDAIAIPSFYEGMPNVMLEAGALGIPVIASDVDGMADVIEQGVDGLLFA
ncbi:MAG: glycosyltransferase family 4 protein, partial [Ekhidna sp.]|nr:glycosyltransferase family 4 protein [Ekhidna sp.]